MLKLFWFFILLRLIYSQEEASRESLVAHAVNSILEDYFAKKSPKVDVIFYGEITKENEKVIEEILCNKPDSIAITVSKSGRENPRRNQLNISSILIFESLLLFREQSKNIVWLSNKRMRHKHLVYVPNITVSEVICNIEDGFIIDSVNFLMKETENSIDLVSSFMFTQYACRLNQLVIINRFLKSSMKWESSTFYPNKYKNLHNCRLNVVWPVMIKRRRTIYLESITESLEKQINFSSNMIEVPMADLRREKYDLTEISANFDGDDDYITSVVLDTSIYSFVVPPGEPYSTLEKMFLMFHFEVWVAIILTLLTAMVVIKVVNFMSIEVQDYIYGYRVTTPMMNLISVFLNGGQFKTPDRSVARFLLMLFIIWTLIIRTCYQSVLFQYLQADMRKPAVKLVRELVEKDFKLFGRASEEPETPFGTL